MQLSEEVVQQSVVDGSEMKLRFLFTMCVSITICVCLVGIGAAVWLRAMSVTEMKHSTIEVPVVFTLDGSSDGNWPCWRGARGDNTVETMSIPVEWDLEHNCEWQVPVEGRGHSSPVVCDGRIFVFSADELKEENLLVSYDLASGRRNWRSVMNQGGFMAKHEKNSHASATPICMMNRVYVTFVSDNAVHVVAVSATDGSIVWKSEGGPFVSEWGYGSSAARFGNSIIVLADNRGSSVARLTATSFLASLDARTGELLWRVRRPEERSYGTPLVAEIAGRKQLVVSGWRAVTAYNPQTGERLWTCNTDADRTANSLAYDSSSVIVTYNQGAKATTRIMADGSGDVTSTCAQWKTTAASADVPSPLISKERVYVASDNGVVTCLKLSDGSCNWKKRVSGTGISSSPVAIGANIYLADEAGEVHIFEDSDEFRSVSDVKMHEPIFASPVVAGDRLLIRTSNHLWCIRSDEEARK